MASIGTLVTTQTILARTAGALFGLELGSTAMTSLAASAGSTTASQTTFLNTLYANSVGASTANSVVVSVVLANLGIPTTDTAVYGGVSAYLQAQLDAVPYAARGGVLNDVLTLFSTLTASPYVVAYNTKIAAAETYAAVSTNTSNASFDTVSSTPSTTGTTFTLTTGADNFTGGALADTFNGFSVAGASAATDTIGASDVINGGAGINTLNITMTDSGAADAGATISNIQIVNIKEVTAGKTATFNAAVDTAATAVNANAGAGAVTVTNLATGATIGVIGNGAIANGTTSYAYKTATDAQTINISGGTTAGNITATASAGATTATITSTGAANTVGTIQLLSAGSTITSLTVNATTDLTAVLTAADYAATAALVISGAAPTTVLATRAIAPGVDLGANTTNFKTIDASGLTAGGAGVTLGAGVTSFKGGAGNDIVTTTGALTATVAGQINAGAGTGDRLIVTTSAGAVNTAITGAEYTGFEIVRNAVTTTPLDVQYLTGITAVETIGGATSGFINLNAASAGAITVFNTATGSTFALKDPSGTSDVVNFNLQNLLLANDATPVSLTTLTVDGFETMNVAAASGISTAITSAAMAGTDIIGFASAANLTTLKVTGANDIVVNLANAVKVTTLDVSGLTGTAGAGITLAANTGALTVTGTANTDFVALATLGAGGSATINAGAGNDTITGTQAQVAADTINGGSGTDTLALTDTATTIADNTFANVSGIEKFTLANTTALTWVVGGYANTIASANAGVLDVTAASVAAAGTITFDASGLGGTNSLKLSLTNTAGGANAVNITGSNNGADNITYVGATSGTGVVTVNDAGTSGSTAVKTIDLSGETWGTAAITTGAGADVIKTGLLAATINSGKGADAITLLSTHTGVQALTMAKGDSGTFTAPTTNSVSTVGFDVITNLKANDTIQLGNGAGVVTTINTASDLTAATYANQTVTDVRGTYTASTNTFVGSSTGADMLMVVDTTAGATVTYESIVLVGYGATTPTSLSAAGLFTA